MTNGARRWLQRAVCIAASWALFGAGLALLGWIDWTMRMRDGRIHDGGIGEPLQHVLVLAVGVLASAFTYYGTWGWRIEARLGLVAMQAFLGFWAYAFATIAYVCGTGIDCF